MQTITKLFLINRIERKLDRIAILSRLNSLAVDSEQYKEYNSLAHQYEALTGFMYHFTNLKFNYMKYVMLFLILIMMVCAIVESYKLSGMPHAWYNEDRYFAFIAVIIWCNLVGWFFVSCSDRIKKYANIN